jgi:hypothetical protein
MRFRNHVVAFRKRLRLHVVASWPPKAPISPQAEARPLSITTILLARKRHCDCFCQVQRQSGVGLRSKSLMVETCTMLIWNHETSHAPSPMALA